MNTTLNNYTIEDFLKLKPIIYEYCCNLTQKKTATSWFRNFADADDLYQEVYIQVATNWFNKPKEATTEGKFIQIMKNYTYWTFHRSIDKRYAINNVNNNLNYYQDSEKSMFLFENINLEDPEYFKDIQDHPDYAFYMKGLNVSERLAITYFLKGYSKTEVAKMFNKKYEYVTKIVKKIEGNALKDKFSKPLIKEKPKKEVVYNDLVFVREKLPNFDKVFKKTKNIKTFENDRKIKMYSLYLQGVSNKDIAEKLGKNFNQINQEIYRINQKVKKYAI